VRYAAPRVDGTESVVAILARGRRVGDSDAARAREKRLSGRLLQLVPEWQAALHHVDVMVLLVRKPVDAAVAVRRAVDVGRLKLVGKGDRGSALGRRNRSPHAHHAAADDGEIVGLVSGSRGEATTVTGSASGGCSASERARQHEGPT